MLSPETQARLVLAREHETEYRPNQDIQRQIGNKVLVMLVGPASMGKTHIMMTAALLDDSFVRVPSFTTREPRPDDERAAYRYIPADEEHVSRILDDIEAGEVVQYGVHPTKGTIYGSMIEDHAAPVNMLATLSNAVEQLRHVGFKRTPLIGLVAEPDVWQEWFLARYPEASPERTARAQEAVLSLEWLLAQPPGEVKWLHNQKDRETATSGELIGLVHGETNDENSGRKLATECLEIARGLII